MSTFRIAWRNLLRNRTRTVISTSAVSLSLLFQLMAFALNDGGYAQLMRAAERAAGGGVLVHAKGWWASRSAEELIQEPRALMEAARGVPGVRAVLPRVIVTGLVSSARGNQGVELRGIDPLAERELEDLSKKLLEGSFLGPGDERPLVLGRRLVEELGLSLGDRVVLTASDPRGELGRALFHLTGVLGGGPTLESTAAFTTLAAAQRALGWGSAVSQVGLALEPKADGRKIKKALLERLPGERGLELLTWQEAVPELLRLIEVDKREGYLFSLIVLAVVAFGVANTFLMSVMERVRELGLLAALGLTPQGVARLVLAETFALTLLSTAVGLLFSVVAHLLLSQKGIDLAALSGTPMEMGGVVLEDYRLRSAFVPLRWLSGVALVVGVVLLSAFYPALRASRLAPLEAMRTHL